MAYTNMNKSSDFFNTKLYTGTGSTQSITGVGFQPDFTWIKNRSTTHDHILTDAVRGVTKDIRSNNSDAEATDSNGLTAFGADGFTVGSKVNINNNGSNILSWNWKAGGGQGSSNTDGSINTTYTSANTTAGFSISSYTGNQTSGASVGHGLGVAPKMILVKSLSEGHAWRVYHKSVGATKELYLNLRDTPYTASNIWNDQEPTSSVFYLGNNDSGTNKSGVTYVAYCFAEKTGYSKFGTFEGNGTAYPNSPFIYLGFKPKLFMWKNIDESGSDDNWNMVDSTAQQYNIQDAGYLMANDSNYNYSGNTINFLSNGVKIDVASAYHNQSGDTYIYMAFGQSIVGSNNVPATAR